ncbi:unnamed protein product [Lasius platythorax]|uniref:Uncharacterized protein n=1 Tax=Lasius platythorax TaxID=488582 RepID=A0AAV2MW69_9HYME
MEMNEKVTLLQSIEGFSESDDDNDLQFCVSSSSTVESEEEEIKNFFATTGLVLNELRGEIQIRPRIKDYVERIIPNYTALEFKTHFRLLPATVELLLELIRPALTATRSASGRKSISAQKQFLMALWMMATPDSYRSVCIKFSLGKATAICTVAVSPSAKSLGWSCG